MQVQRLWLCNQGGIGRGQRPRQIAKAHPLVQINAHQTRTARLGGICLCQPCPRVLRGGRDSICVVVHNGLLILQHQIKALRRRIGGRGL